ncbi:MAG: PP2C family protein-serine/threonine phosphatase, partial [Saprospiraceae bacterium]
TERISPVHIRVFVLIWIIIFIFTLLIVIFEVGMIQKILKTIPFVVNNIHTAAEEHNRLTLENNRMSAELDVARRIQKMVLPQNSEWEGYKNLSFAARMLPATEIGGDYYDILIQPDGSVYFAIGDVTDHGLQSGVVMLMAQTAFRSVIEDKDIDLSEVIIRMNSILYSNIHDRMKDFRNLTLSLLHYKDGTLSICGQHESIIIIRKGKSEPEIIETLDLGMYVGLMPNIQEYTAILKTYLEIGDKVILYTDGIVEAENNKKELYGMDNFLQSVKSNYFEHPKELLSCILHDLEGFTENKSLLDDVSVLIFQRMK